jgi:hypothetical protein
MPPEEGDVKVRTEERRLRDGARSSRSFRVVVAVVFLPRGEQLAYRRRGMMIDTYISW